MSATSLKLHPQDTTVKHPSSSNPLPQLVHTPSGLAILELQGTINLPESQDEGPIEVGRLDFPDYDPAAPDADGAKRVHMFIGQHQHLTGEVKKLPKPIAVVRRRETSGEVEGSGEQTGDLEVVEIVKYKLMFSNRPEPVGTAAAP